LTASPSQQKLAVEINLTAQNSKSEVQKELFAEFARVFEHVSPEVIEWAFREWRMKSSYFPGVADIGKLIQERQGGIGSDDEKKIEADAAWAYVNDYLRKWGVDLLPIRSGGKEILPPPLDARVEYSLRRIGGLQALNQMDVNRMPFMYRDFCEAYTQAPLAELMARRLEQQFGTNKMLTTVEDLIRLKPMLPKKAPEER
jgi:hypothetical protein